jgi:hypothetical protein
VNKLIKTIFVIIFGSFFNVARGKVFEMENFRI